MPSEKEPLSKTEVAGMTAIQILGILGTLFALFGLLFNRRDAPEFLYFWLLLFVGCIGLLLLQRWAAVLVTALGWFVQLTFVWFGIRDDRTGQVYPDVAVVWAVSLLATLLFTVL